MAMPSLTRLAVTERSGRQGRRPRERPAGGASSTARSTGLQLRPGPPAPRRSRTPWPTTAAATRDRGTSSRRQHEARRTTSTTCSRSSTARPRWSSATAMGATSLSVPRSATGATDPSGPWPPTSHRMPWLARGRHAARRRWPSGRRRPAADPAEPTTTRRPPNGSSAGWSATAAWDRLSEKEKAGRRADGPALAAELAAIRVTEPPFDVGGAGHPGHLRQGRGLAPPPPPGGGLAGRAHARSRALRDPRRRHGAHLTHPDAFAAMVRRALALARPAGAARPAMNVLVAGSSGLIGTALVDRLGGGRPHGDPPGPGRSAAGIGHGGRTDRDGEMGPGRRALDRRGAARGRAHRRGRQPGRRRHR